MPPLTKLCALAGRIEGGHQDTIKLHDFLRWTSDKRCRPVRDTALLIDGEYLITEVNVLLVFCDVHPIGPNCVSAIGRGAEWIFAICRARCEECRHCIWITL